jgi:hypothetical protein
LADWFAGVEKRALKLGDYSIAGLEDLCVVKRKDPSLKLLLENCGFRNVVEISEMGEILDDEIPITEAAIFRRTCGSRHSEQISMAHKNRTI